jgi:hypothetical protein
MAIRRPSISSPAWLFQDFLYLDNSPEQLRYLQVKWDGEPYTRVSQSFDFSNPPYDDDEQRGGFIVAQVDYTIEGYLVTIDQWDVNWRDEWPLRLAANYLQNCLYRQEEGYVIQVAKDAYSFWVSEYFFPVSNEPFTDLYSWRG